MWFKQQFLLNFLVFFVAFLSISKTRFHLCIGRSFSALSERELESARPSAQASNSKNENKVNENMETEHKLFENNADQENGQSLEATAILLDSKFV